MSVPQDCPEKTFTTSFGVTFGMATCADMIFKRPALTLANKGVKHFVVPVAWNDEMS